MAGTIIARKRRDGSTGYRAEVIAFREGRVAHRESKTFDRRQAAQIWLEKRQKELDRPGGVEAAKTKVRNATLGDAIDRYVATSQKAIGKTKAQVLGAIKQHPIAAMPCDEIRSADIIEFATVLGQARAPQTVSNYLSHLAAVFAIARPAWGFALDQQEMADATRVAKRLGYTSRSRERDRRPSVEEISRIMDFYRGKRKIMPTSPPMLRIIPFALYSTRRQEEITRIRWADYDAEGRVVIVRDMKNPGEKIGNDVRVDLPPEAAAIIDAMPRIDARIFPYDAKTISASFTRSCQMLGIEDLHFHDLRHEGISRLFELGWNIPHVAAVSGHRSWASLKRYTHIRAGGDKWAGNWWR